MMLKSRNGLILLAVFLVVLLVWPPFQSGVRGVVQDLIGEEISLSDPFSPLEGEAAPSGAEYYVAQHHPQASDNNQGSNDAPWLTIQHAAASVADWVEFGTDYCMNRYNGK